MPAGHGRRVRPKERVTHRVAEGAYMYLLLTRLAFWSPWLFWVAVLLGGAPVSRMLHPWAGLIFFAAVSQMYVMWSPQKKQADRGKRGGKAVGYHITDQNHKKPPAGR